MSADRFLLALACLGSFFQLRAEAQVLPLRVEDVVEGRSFSEFTSPEFSPDGKWLVYAVKDNRKRGVHSLDQYARTGVLLNGLGADLFLAQVDGGETRNLTGGTGNNWAPAWSPDGQHVAFLSDRDGSGQAKLWIAEPAAGTLRKASDLRVRANRIEWLPDSQRVLLTALPENLTPEEFAGRLSAAAAKDGRGVEKAKVPGSTAVVYRSTPDDSHGLPQAQYGPWNLESYLRDLVLVDIENGKNKRLDAGHRVAAYALSPDGSHVAFIIAQRFEKPGSQQILFDLAVIALRTGEAQVLASDVRLRPDGVSFNWAPGSSRLLYQTGGPEGAGNCYVAELEGGPPRKITSQGSPPRRGAPPPLWDSEGRHIYFLRDDVIWKADAGSGKSAPLAKILGHHPVELVSERGVVLQDRSRNLLALTYDDESKQSGFYAVDPETGASDELLQKGQSYAASAQDHNVSASPDGKRLAFFLEDAGHAPEICLASPDFRQLRRLTHINAPLDKYLMGESRLIGWQSLDGETLHGALLLPAGYSEGQHYPLIVCVYGGARLSNALVQFGPGCSGMNMQLFATRGYAVLLPDAPQRMGTPMADLAKTVLPGVERVIEMGIADPSRLGVMGHSYGGYSALSLIVQTTRFRAAVDADGPGDLIASYGQMSKDGSAFAQASAETGQMLMGGTPWQFRDRYIENSPVFYLDRIQTPLLIVHGGEDTTVPAFLADEVFVELRRLGKEVQYAKYEGEGHSPLEWSYANQRDFSARVIAWFDGHLK